MEKILMTLHDKEEVDEKIFHIYHSNTQVVKGRIL